MADDDDRARYAEAVAETAIILATVRDCSRDMEDETLAGIARELVDSVKAKLDG